MYEVTVLWMDAVKATYTTYEVATENGTLYLSPAVEYAPSDKIGIPLKHVRTFSWKLVG
jgi:hypothetical protein